GDAAFQQKCFDELNRMRDEGRTIVLVTHDMTTGNRFCHRALLLERGEMVMIGAPYKVSERYVELNFSHQLAREQQLALEGQESPMLQKAAEIVKAWFEDEDGAQ